MAIDKNEWQRLPFGWREHGIYITHYRDVPYNGQKQRRRQYAHTQVCSVCGGEYITARQHSNTCGPKCRKRKSREKAPSA